MVITAKCKVNAANNTLPVLTDVFTNVHRISAVGDERFERYAVPYQVSYMTLSQVIHVSAMPHMYIFLESNGNPRKV